MKIFKLFTVFAMSALIGIMLNGCKIDYAHDWVDESVRVESVELNPDLKSGVELLTGQILSVSGKVTVTPADAASQVETYSSSNSNVASIDESGQITANYPGTTQIMVTVDGKSDWFTLTVVEAAEGAIRVDRVELDPALTVGVELQVGASLEIADKVAITPADATYPTATYTSSDNNVASVYASGKVTALKMGTTTITVTADGKSNSFVVTVIPAIGLADGLRIPTGATYRIWQHITVASTMSDPKIKGITLSSSAEAIATVDQNGVIKGIAPGNATITVADASYPAANKTLDITVVDVDYYPRNLTESSAITPWSMETSHPLAGTGNGNGPLAALDGIYGDDNQGADEKTVFIMTRPGKNISGVSVPATDPIWFVVDMKEPKVVDVFKIIPRSGPNTNRATRYFGFDEIAGSNDGTNFTPIATNVEVADAQSPILLSVSETTFTNDVPYQYIRFTAKTVGFCFNNGMSQYPGIDKLFNNDGTPNTTINGGTIKIHGDNDGNTVQMQEIYLGKVQ